VKHPVNHKPPGARVEHLGALGVLARENGKTGGLSQRRKDARKQSPEKWFETFLLSHGGVERHTVIVEPRVPRGISSGSLALDGVGLYPSRQKKASPRWASPASGGGPVEESWARCPCHGRRLRSPSHAPLCDSAPLRCSAFPFFPPPPWWGIRPRLRPYKMKVVPVDKALANCAIIIISQEKEERTRMKSCLAGMSLLWYD